MTFDWRRTLWRGTGHAIAPAVALWLRHRSRIGKEDAARLPERMGVAGKPRPAGLVVWCHGASVGESQALLPLLQALHEQRPDLTLLLTTGTVTSAALVAKRAVPGVLHQFVPVDLPKAVDRFLDHWRPDLVLWSESDFWPGILSSLHTRHIPTLLINARMSERSCRRWAGLPETARWLLQGFAAVYAQTAQDAERLRRLGVSTVIEAGNLKHAAPPLPVNAGDLADWRRRLDLRPLWLAASTHAGEEKLVAEAHRRMKDRHPDLITLIVPRHPERGTEIAAELAGLGLRCALRSRNEMPDAQTDIYIADTLGELGLWFRISPIVLMGGSLIPHGGHNPLEPARLGSAVLFGRHMFNFAEVSAALLQAGGAILVQDIEELSAALVRLFEDQTRLRAIADAGQAYAAGPADIVERLSAAVLNYLPAPTA